MPSITQLEYLLAVDRNRHFGKAAKECNVSQPSLSIQLQKVEEELDIIIFDRSKKPILPTERGIDVINQAKVVIREHERLKHIAKKENSTLKGNFRLAVIPTLSPYVIPYFIKSFSSKYPEVNLEINEYQTHEIIKLLENDQIDAGLLVTPLKEESIIERSLFFEPFHLYVSKDHPLYKRKKISDSDLDGNDVWLLDEGHCFRDQVIKVCSLKKDKNSRIQNVSFKSGNLETLKNIIRQGSGYTLLPHMATTNLSKSEKDNMVKKFSKPVPTREVSLVHSRLFLKEDIIDALEKEIIENIPKELTSLKSKDFQIIDI